MLHRRRKGGLKKYLSKHGINQKDLSKIIHNYSKINGIKGNFDERCLFISKHFTNFAKHIKQEIL